MPCTRAAAEMGAALQDWARRMFHWWHRVRGGPLTHASYRTYMQPIRRAAERLLEAMMAVVATLKQQHRNVLDYLTDACKKAPRADPALSLLPS